MTDVRKTIGESASRTRATALVVAAASVRRESDDIVLAMTLERLVREVSVRLADQAARSWRASERSS